MRQRYAFGSNIATVRCGWDAHMMSNSRFYSFVMLSEAKHLCGFLSVEILQPQAASE